MDEPKFRWEDRTTCTYECRTGQRRNGERYWPRELYTAYFLRASRTNTGTRSDLELTQHEIGRRE